VEPLDKRRNLKILLQAEKMKRLHSHPLHDKLAQPTKNRLKRQSLNHLYKDLRGRYREVTDVPYQPLPDACWRPDQEADITLHMTVPGITSREQLPADLLALTKSMIEDQYPQHTWTHVFTDGSSEEAVRQWSSGVYIRFPDRDKTISAPGGTLCSNYRAEVLAISTAAEYLAECGKQLGNVVIFTDSVSTMQTLNSANPDQTIQNLHSSLSKLTAKPTPQWVPAHASLRGNEQADWLAKAGSQMPQKQHSTTYQEMKTLLHSRFRADWSQHNAGYQAHLDPIRRLDRQQQTVIFRLRTGHCRLRSHLKKIGVSETALCECGLADQTPQHILQDCPSLSTARQQVWPEGVELTTKLWGPCSKLHRTVHFISTTGLLI